MGFGPGIGIGILIGAAVASVIAAIILIAIAKSRKPEVNNLSDRNKVKRRENASQPELEKPSRTRNSKNTDYSIPDDFRQSDYSAVEDKKAEISHEKGDYFDLGDGTAHVYAEPEDNVGTYPRKGKGKAYRRPEETEKRESSCYNTQEDHNQKIDRRSKANFQDDENSYYNTNPENVNGTFGKRGMPKDRRQLRQDGR